MLLNDDVAYMDNQLAPSLHILDTTTRDKQPAAMQ
jgi:hypothetical protein